MKDGLRVLGFHCYGCDSAAALLTGGAVTMAVEEERLNRRKHSGEFPELAIRECLGAGGIEVADLDHVGFAWNPWVSYVHMPVYAVRYLPRVLTLLRESREWTMEEDLGGLTFLRDMFRLPAAVRGLGGGNRRARFRFHFLAHHECHAASAFYPSPFEESAILTVDGAGEWTTATLARGRGTRMERISRVNVPHSLGAFYHAISRYLGFEYIEGPGKLMALASYGDRAAEQYRRLRSMFELRTDGGFRTDMSYFSYHYTRKKRGLSEKFYREMGPANEGACDWTEAQLNVAAGAQRAVEEVMLHMAGRLRELTGSRNLCVAGGVGLNSVANGRLVKESGFKEVFIQPAASDSGTALGAALLIQHGILGRERAWRMEDAFIGPCYSAQRMAGAVDARGLPRVESAEYAKIAARLLAAGKIVGWFQGRLEFGPRALGNRSILASPCVAEMKDVLNARVKFRESFRPFAPIVIADRCGEYFDCSYPSPFMLKVYGVREGWRGRLPAITHVDGSARVQTVTSAANPAMHELLTAFERETGVPVLLNTSFNVKGEPIVCTPEDAVACFVKTGMDFLVMGRNVVGKKAEDAGVIRAKM